MNNKKEQHKFRFVITREASGGVVNNKKGNNTSSGL